MKITWQDLEGVIKRSGKRERERERVAVLTAGHKFNVNPGRYRFLLSSVRGWGLDRPPPGFFFFFFTIESNRRIKSLDVKSSHGSKYPSFCTRVNQLARVGNTDLFGPFFPPLPPVTLKNLTLKNLPTRC